MPRARITSNFVPEALKEITVWKKTSNGDGSVTVTTNKAKIRFADVLNMIMEDRFPPFGHPRSGPGG